MTFSRLAAIAAATCALLLMFAGSALAAPPANDNFANAISLQDGVSDTGTTVDSTAESGEQFAGLGWTLANSVWFEFTPASSGLVTISACTNFEVNLIAGYGALGSLTLARDTAPTSYAQNFSLTSGCDPGYTFPVEIGPFPVTAGVPVKIHLGSALGDDPIYEGGYEITAALTPAPANDNLADAAPLSDAVPYLGTTVAASDELGEGFDALGGMIGNSVWHSYTPERDGVLAIEVCSQRPPSITVGTGSAYPLTTSGNVGGFPYAHVGSLDEGTSCAYPASLSVPVQAGVELKIRIGSFLPGTSEQGFYAIYAWMVTPPANDDLSSALDLGNSRTVSQAGHNFATTTGSDLQEPQIDGESRSNMVWFKWQSPFDGPADINTCTTSGKLAIAMFTSEEPAPTTAELTPVADGESASGCDSIFGARILTEVQQGETYWIAVASREADSYNEGSFRVQINTGLSLVSPPEISGSDNWLAGDTLTANAGSWDGSEPLVYDFQWLRCDQDGETCDEIADATLDNYETTAADLGHRIRVQVTTSNPLDQKTARSAASGIFDGDDDGDGVNDTYDKCPSVQTGTVKTNGCIPETVNVTSNPALSANAGVVLGQQLTVDPGSAENFPGEDPDLADPAYTVDWFACTSTVDPDDDCTQRAADQSDYTVHESNTSSDSDGGKYIRARINWTNDDGDDWQVYTPASNLIADVCPGALQGGGKTNGCPKETITNTQPPTLTGTAQQGQALSAGDGLWSTPGIDPGVGAIGFTYAWLDCNSAGLDCNPIDGAALATYKPGSAQVGRYIRVRVTATNSDGSTEASSAIAGPVTADSDLDGLPDSSDSCPNDAQGAGKTNGCPHIEISVTTQPSLSGTAQVGQTLTLNKGSAINSPDIDPSTADPSAVFIKWQRCDNPNDLSNCLDLSDSDGSETYTLTAADVGKTIHAQFNWVNGEGSVDVHTLSAVVAAAPSGGGNDGGGTGTITPLDLSKLKLPKKASAKKLVKAKGKFTIKSIVFACPAGGATCKISLSYTAKIKKKTKKLGSSTLTIPAGQSKPLSGKLSSSGLKLLKANKKLKVTIAMKGSGGGAGKATFKEFTITK